MGRAGKLPNAAQGNSRGKSLRADSSPRRAADSLFIGAHETTKGHRHEPRHTARGATQRPQAWLSSYKDGAPASAMLFHPSPSQRPARRRTARPGDDREHLPGERRRPSPTWPAISDGLSSRACADVSLRGCWSRTPFRMREDRHRALPLDDALGALHRAGRRDDRAGVGVQRPRFPATMVTVTESANGTAGGARYVAVGPVFEGEEHRQYLEGWTNRHLAPSL